MGFLEIQCTQYIWLQSASALITIKNSNITQSLSPYIHITFTLASKRTLLVKISSRIAGSLSLLLKMMQVHGRKNMLTLYFLTNVRVRSPNYFITIWKICNLLLERIIHILLFVGSDINVKWKWTFSNPSHNDA